jgi:serine protease AprX
MKPRFSFLATVVVAALAAAPQQSGDSAARAKIAPWILDRTADGKPAEFLIVLGGAADLSGARAARDPRTRRALVRNALLDRATAAQAPIVAWLRQRGVEHRPFYIVNAIWVRADLLTALALAARPDVARLEANLEIRNVLEPPPADRPEARVSSSPNAIEQGVAYIHAPEVWATGFTGQGIVVGGADTGIQWDHPALKGHYRGWNGSAASHDFNWHDSIHSAGTSNPCGSDAPAPCDDYSVSHGTHTMGTMVGDDGAGNQIGVAPGAKWIGCRNMDEGVGTPARYIECMEWFLAPYPVGGTPAQGDPDMAPDVTNNSWGCPPSEGCPSALLQAAVENQRAAGIMLIASAGNGGGAPPAGCSTVIDPPSLYDAAYTVGAIDASDGTLASFSARGPVTADGSGRRKPDVTAPGVFVRSSIRGGFGLLTGTSMAAPHVAGAIALLWSAHPELRQQIADTETIVNGSAAAVSDTSCGGPPVPNNVYGFGRINIKTAVDLAAVTVTNIAPHAGRVSGGQVVTLTGSFATLSTVAIGGVPVTWSYSGGTGAITFTTPAHAQGSVDLALSPTTGGTLTRADAFAFLPTTFTDNTLVAGTTVAKAQHILELRVAIDALRAVAGLPAAAWTDPALSAGSPIKAVHVAELRSFLDAAAVALGYSSGPYIDPSLAAGFLIKRAHVEELRQRIRDIAG